MASVLSSAVRGSKVHASDSPVSSPSERSALVVGRPGQGTRRPARVLDAGHKTDIRMMLGMRWAAARLGGDRAETRDEAHAEPGAAAGRGSDEGARPVER